MIHLGTMRRAYKSRHCALPDSSIGKHCLNQVTGFALESHMRDAFVAQIWLVKYRVGIYGSACTLKFQVFHYQRESRANVRQTLGLCLMNNLFVLSIMNEQSPQLLLCLLQAGWTGQVRSWKKKIVGGHSHGVLRQLPYVHMWENKNENHVYFR